MTHPIKIAEGQKVRARIRAVMHDHLVIRADLAAEQIQQLLAAEGIVREVRVIQLHMRAIEDELPTVDELISSVLDDIV